MAEVDFCNLPNAFVLKPTHGSGDVVVVRDKTKADLEGIRKKIQDELDEFICSSAAELHYTRIPHRVVAEELLVNDDWSLQYSSTLIDYKIWCFNGKAKYIWVCMNRFVHNKDGAEVMTYDRDWNAHPEYCRLTPDFSLAELCRSQLDTIICWRSLKNWLQNFRLFVWIFIILKGKYILER